MNGPGVIKCHNQEQVGVWERKSQNSTRGRNNFLSLQGGDLAPPQRKQHLPVAICPGILGVRDGL